MARPDLSRDDCTLGIVGTGSMGRGIAQIAASAGISVLLSDADQNAAQSAVDFVSRMLARQAEKGRMQQADADAASERLSIVPSPDALADCHVVVEAIVEDLEAKQGLFSELEGIVSEDCILASNTSSLSVTAIASGCAHPERVCGFHFFNPAPLMKIVEVVAGELTDPSVADALAALGERMGHFAARTVDSPGFLVNHAGRGFGTEALAIVDEGVAGYADIDRVLRETAGFRMGPFELFDLTGLDVSHHVMESIYRQFYEETRFRPSPLTQRRVNAGLLGHKSGRGFYRYEDGRKVDMPEQPVPDAASKPVWLGHAEQATKEALHALLDNAGAELDTGESPDDASLCLLAPLGEDTTSAALAAGVDPRRTVAVDTLLGLENRRTLMTTPVTFPEYRDAAHALLAFDGTPVTVVHDSPGFINQRVLAHIVNVGCHIAQMRIAAPEAINRAVEFGLGYPYGPLAFGDRLGPGRILTILENMQRVTGDPRYRPSPWLRRRASLGAGLDTPET